MSESITLSTTQFIDLIDTVATKATRRTLEENGQLKKYLPRTEAMRRIGAKAYNKAVKVGQINEVVRPTSTGRGVKKFVLRSEIEKYEEGIRLTLDAGSTAEGVQLK